MQRPNNNEAGGWFLRGRAPLKKCHKWYGASASERGRSRGFQRAMAEVVSPQNRRASPGRVRHETRALHTYTHTSPLKGHSKMSDEIINACAYDMDKWRGYLDPLPT